MGTQPWRWAVLQEAAMGLSAGFRLPQLGQMLRWGVSRCAKLSQDR